MKKHLWRNFVTTSLTIAALTIIPACVVSCSSTPSDITKTPSDTNSSSSKTISKKETPTKISNQKNSSKSTKKQATPSKVVSTNNQSNKKPAAVPNAATVAADTAALPDSINPHMQANNLAQFPYTLSSLVWFSNGFNVTPVSKNQLVITACFLNTKNLTIPTTMTIAKKSFEVVALAPAALANLQLSSVSFPSSLTSIGAYALANNNLSIINLPTNLQYLGAGAFWNNNLLPLTTITLPNNTQWSKTKFTSPFVSRLGAQFANNSVVRILQNDYLYTYSAKEQSYIITGAEDSALQSGVRTGWCLEQSSVVTFPTITASPSFNTSAVNFSAHYNLPAQPATANTMLTLSWAGNGLGSTAYGATNLATVKFANNTVVLAPASSQSWKYVASVSNQTAMFVSVSLYNQSMQLIKTLTLNNANLQTLSASYVQGDYISFSTNIFGTQLNNCVLNQPMNIYNTVFAFNTSSNNTAFYQLNSSLKYVQPLTVLTMQNTLNVNHKTTSVSGTTLPNETVSLNLNHQTYTTTSDTDGLFTFTNVNTQNVTPQTSFVISVNGSLPLTSHFCGLNPLNSVIALQTGVSANADFGLAINGYNNRLMLVTNDFWQSLPPVLSANDAADNNLYQKATKIWSSTTLQNTSISLKIGVNNQVYTITFANQTITSVANEIAKISATIGDTLTIQFLNNNAAITSGTNSVILGVFNNGNTGATYRNSEGIYTIKTSMNGYQMVQNKGDNIAYNETSNNYSSLSLADYVYGGNGWAAGNIVGWEVVGAAKGWAWNWDSPILSSALVNAIEAFKTDQAVNNSSNPSTYANATLFNTAYNTIQWLTTNSNFAYNFGPKNSQKVYEYGQSAAEIFNRKNGVCADFVEVALTMLQSEGFVARAVTGLTAGTNQYPQPYTLSQGFNNISSGNWNNDHVWIQVWDESAGTWLTFDPTWGGQYNSHPGDNSVWFDAIRSDYDVCAIVWPKNTNYLSYFKNAPYEAFAGVGIMNNFVSSTSQSYNANSTLMIYADVVEKTSQITWNTANETTVEYNYISW